MTLADRCSAQEKFSERTISIAAITLFLLLSFLCLPGAAEENPGFQVLVTDLHTANGIAGAAVYLDGRYYGVTASGPDPGILMIPDITLGSHTVRITCPGYQQITRKVKYPDTVALNISLERSALVSLTPENTNSHAINVVFIPSSTYYRTSDKSKVSTDEYTGNETHFREDVEQVINRTFQNFSGITDSSVPVPAISQNALRFSYYFGPDVYADAFSGCAGSVSEQYWNKVTFSDLTIILYPRYDGWHTDASTQPVGCFEDSGTGHKLMKIPMNRDLLVYHELGHALFGLVDTYCGDTVYFENDPFPNVWSSSEACRNRALSTHRDPSQCRIIEQDSGNHGVCTKSFWRWDPDPDIMRESSGKFGAASTERIGYILSKAVE